MCFPSNSFLFLIISELYFDQMFFCWFWLLFVTVQDESFPRNSVPPLSFFPMGISVVPVSSLLRKYYFEQHLELAQSGFALESEGWTVDLHGLILFCLCRQLPFEQFFVC